MSQPILLLSLAAFVASATTRLCDALLPAIAGEFAVPVSAAAVAVTAFTAAYGLFQLAYGPVGARIGPYRTAALGTMLSTVGTLACAFAPSLGWLALGRAASGLTAAAIIPMAMAHIGESVPYERRQAVIARFLMGSITGVIAGQSLAGLFADIFTWRQLFVVLAAGFAVIGALLLKGAATASTGPRPPAGAALQQYRAVLAAPWARVVLLTVSLEGFLCFGAYPYLSVHLQRQFGLDYLAIGLVMSAFGLGGLAYAMSVRLLLARLGETGLAATGGLLLAFCYLLAAVAPVWQAVVPATMGLGLGFYMLHNTLQTNATQMAPENRSAAISLFAFCLFVSQSLGAALLGVAGEITGFRVLFVVAGLGLLGVALGFRRQKRAVAV
ncbi:MFS transporter [Marinimicrococcus flavescens]|uniref:MFS transporter n=1 Tax=Marinimicrococcus flavescens TaxID=3031815 RepID=A0AAP3XS91_9PROT|nr:MFS transporter [Marinimicrococcus flavescens]